MTSPWSADLLDTAPCGFISFDDEGRIRLVNATLAERLGYTVDELVDERVETIFTRAGQLFYQTHFFPLVRLHGRAQEVFLLLRTRTDDTFGALCNAVRRTRDDRPVTDCILLEVNERRKYEDALLEAKRAAEQANRQLEAQAIELEMQHHQLQDQTAELEAQAEELERQREAADRANSAKSDFLATMSHELRTPLNAIGGYASLLHDGVYGEISARQTEAVERIMRSQRHLLGLINDVLNLARVEAGRVEYKIERVGVSAVVAELATMIEPQLAAKGLRYHVDFPDAALEVRADRDKLVQILLNLLSNAIKFTDRGGSITTRAAASSRTTVRVDVVDTGRGIPHEKLASVFEPFVQVRADPSKPNEGTGLGLAISRNLARGMGGDLTATSEVGKGSCFSLTLVRADAE